MDPYEELKQKASAMAKKLTEQGKQPRLYQSHNAGSSAIDSIEAWPVLTYRHVENRRNGNDWATFESIILGKDGVLYEYYDLQVGHNEEEDHEPRSAIRVPWTSTLVNIGEGKPFSKLMEAIERMPWT